MSETALIFLAAAGYLAGAWWLSRGLGAGGGPPHRFGIVLGCMVVALICHGAILFRTIAPTPGLEISLTVAFSLVTWTAVFAYLLISLYPAMINLGLIIAPVAAVAVLLAWWLPGTPRPVADAGAGAVHAVVAVIAIGLLSLAAAQAVLLIFQERQLHTRQPARLLTALPSIETMERVMLRLILAGFALLSVTLVSGIVFSEELFDQPFQFNHHVVLSIAAWLVFGILLAGRARYGWRSSRTGVWTVTGFAILALAYFGTRFVLEVVLQR